MCFNTEPRKLKDLPLATKMLKIKALWKNNTKIIKSLTVKSLDFEQGDDGFRAA